MSTRSQPPLPISPPQLPPPTPTLSVALERFLTRNRFAARTRQSYAQDLAPLLAPIGQQPVPA